jgi:hypothetical protein
MVKAPASQASFFFSVTLQYYHVSCLLIKQKY